MKKGGNFTFSPTPVQRIFSSFVFVDHMLQIQITILRGNFYAKLKLQFLPIILSPFINFLETFD
jgi:hypothetical protein